MALDRADGRPVRHRSALLASAIVVALAYSWIAGHFSTFTAPAEVVTFIPGLLGMLVAIRPGPRGSARPGRSRHGWLGWWLIAAGFTAIELVALALGSTHSHPTVSDLVNPWLLSTPSRAAGFAVWLGFGFWLSRR